MYELKSENGQFSIDKGERPFIIFPKGVSLHHAKLVLDAFREAAQLRVQRIAFGSGLRVWFANLFIRFGWWFAGNGNR